MTLLRQTTLKTIKSTATTTGGGNLMSSLNRRLVTSRSFGIIAANNSSTTSMKLVSNTTHRSTISAALIHTQQQQQQQQQQQSSTCSDYHPAAMLMTAAAAIVGAVSTSTLLTLPATSSSSSSSSSEIDCNYQFSTAVGTSTTKATAVAEEGRRLNVNNDNLHRDNLFFAGTNSAAGGARVADITKSSSSRYCHCEELTSNHHAPSVVAGGTVKSRHQNDNRDDDEVITATSPTTNNEEEEDNLPTYTMSTVSQYNGQSSPTNPNKRIWMTYGGYVYDVTEFIVNHPGGSEKIMLGAGGAIEPYWYLYRQHFASSLPMNLLSKMIIGKLHPSDQEHIDEQMENVAEQTPDPYENEPERNIQLIVHGDTPMNAEVPEEMITMSYLTPNDMFYIRHHHPVPYLNEGALEEFRLEVDLTLLFPDAMKRKKKAEGGDGSSSSGGGSNDDDLATTTSTTAVDIVRRETADTGASKSCSNSVVAKLSLEQIKSLPKVELTSTLQCSGNRRGGFNSLRQTSGTPWGQGAISTAKWGGARLIDVLMLAMDEASKEVVGPNGKKRKWKNKYGGGGGGGGDDGRNEQSLIETLHNLQQLIDGHPELQHLRFESLDGMLASIDANKGLNPFGDVIIAYEMNGEDLPRDHGYPLRVIVPGYAAVRNVKWLKKLELAEEEAFGTWQRGLNYKILPPTVLDAKEVDLDIMPGLSEECVFSGITRVENLSHTPVVAHDSAATTTATTLEDEIFGSMSVGRGLGGGPRTPLTPGETVLVKASGWAYAGGGRNIVRVDVTGNNGKSWQTATITEGYNQPIRRAWAWVFWECEVPAIVCEDGVSVELACKGVDMAFNTQPESLGGMWNVRGLVNNSYYRVKHKVM